MFNKKIKMKKLLLVLVVLGITLQSCSDRLCPAYGQNYTKFQKKQNRRR